MKHAISRDIWQHMGHCCLSQPGPHAVQFSTCDRCAMVLA
jgi:hypothetical protein